MVVALVTELTDELIAEGFAREMVNKIQNMRKSSGLEVTDLICVFVHTTDRVKKAVQQHDGFIRHETLADKMEFSDTGEPEGSTRWDINGEQAAIAVSKV